MLMETLVHSLTSNVTGTPSVLAVIPQEAGTVVVAVLGLVLLGRLVWRVFFTEVEEEQQSPYRSTLRPSAYQDHTEIASVVDASARIGHTARSWVRSNLHSSRPRRASSSRTSAIAGA
jgi:hypothetical protein